MVGILWGNLKQMDVAGVVVAGEPPFQGGTEVLTGWEILKREPGRGGERHHIDSKRRGNQADRMSRVETSQ